MRYTPLAERFWAKVDVTPDTDDCWLWRGVPTMAGYGRIRIDGCTRYAHRVAWMLFNGPIPEGLVIRHDCDTPLCVNPWHLDIGTTADNIHDMVERRRAQHTYKISAEQASEIRGRLARGDVSQGELAAEYGISRGHVSNVAAGIYWTY